MATGLVSWSQTAASNATADSNVAWPEGMAPSAVNDSARAMMASVAKYRDDVSGSLVTGGTTTAYTVTSNQSFASLSALNGHTLTVRFNATNGATPTLNVDSLGAKAIKTDLTNAVATGAIVADSIHRVTYDNANSCFIIHDTLGAWRSGTFTPTVTLVGGSSNTTPVYSTNTGRYTRYANRCRVDVQLNGDGGAEGAGSGNINIALPFAASASAEFSRIPVGTARNNASFLKLCGSISGGASTIALVVADDFSASPNLTGADQNNATRSITLSFDYEI